jgi:4-amino-4-deoxy-L-arabinose transferase-like glycosyltransferase
VREIVRRNLRFFLFATLAALGLRLIFLFRFPSVTSDSLIYGDIARNWLQHGIYGITTSQGVDPTFIRLPGYPAFLAVVFSIFGVENYRAALALQVVVDIATCFVIADMARRMISARAAKAAFLLAGLCPFFANYAAAALTETLEIFFTALALDFALAGLGDLGDGFMRPWLGCGLAIGAAILLRPDGGLLLISIAIYFFLLLLRGLRPAAASPSAGRVLQAGLIVVVAATAPLILWTLRNEHTLQRFQPLAPRYANEENEFVPAGFNRWVKTWIADYVSVEEIYWAVPDGEMDAEKLPGRAFDSAQQRQQTVQLVADYNHVLHITPALDARFAALAAQRVEEHRWRYYISLPLLRIVDMWLRPRTELLPSDTRWWEFDDDPKWSVLAIALGVIGLLYFGAALAELFRAQLNAATGLLITFVVVRSAFLGTLENPEPRYTLECYPVLLLLVSLLFR